MVLSIPKYNRVRLVQSFNCTSLATSECDASCMLVRRKCFRELIAATSIDILEFLVVKLYYCIDWWMHECSLKLDK